MTRPIFRPGLLLLCGLLAAGPALAQGGGTAPPPGSGSGSSPGPNPGAESVGAAETVLILSETAELGRAPDEVRATLRAEARGASAAAVQAQVNTLMEKALAQSRTVAGVRATTGGYWTSRNEENRNWTASQALNLRGGDAPALLELAGALQGQGLAMSQLGWQLSRAQQTAARQEAGRRAIEALRQRAEAVAAQLGLRVAGIRNLRLDAPDSPVPRPMAMAMAARGQGAPAPVTAPEDVIVSSTAVAEFILRP